VKLNFCTAYFPNFLIQNIAHLKRKDFLQLTSFSVGALAIPSWMQAMPVD
jgi:hypothetical protein